MMRKENIYTIVDLFAGAGGLSEGFVQAGFMPIAHVEMDKDACNTLRTRSCYHYLRSRGKLDIYYKYLKEEITREVLYASVPKEIVDSVIKIFDLMKHYGIDPNYKYAKTALMGEYHDRVSISKTPYDAVKIKVLDKDPQMACNIANEIIRLYDVKFEIIHKTKKWENVKSYGRQLKQITNFIDSLSNELAKITDEGNILNYQYLSKGNSTAFFIIS